MTVLTRILLLLLVVSCSSASAQYRSVHLRSPFKKNWTKRTTDIANWYDVTKSLPEGHVKDGSVDYTKYVQNALDSYKRVKMPDFPVAVSGIFANSGQRIFFQDNSKLVMTPTKSERYEVLSLHGVKDVVVYNANIKGDLDLHKGTTGEWGYGIGIRSSQDVQIYNSTITHCWGDGLVIAQGGYYFRRGAKGLPTNNIVIDGISIDYTRRNGITIGNGQDLTIKNVIISNVFGIAPKAGIDIEPDLSNHGKLENVSFQNIKIYNVQSGFAALLDLFIDSRLKNSANIVIEDLEVRNAQSALHFSGYSKKQNAIKLDGKILVNNFKMDAVEIPVRIREGSNYFPTVEISNYTIRRNGRIYKNNKEKLLERTKTDKNIINIK